MILKENTPKGTENIGNKYAMQRFTISVLKFQASGFYMVILSIRKYKIPFQDIHNLHCTLGGICSKIMRSPKYTFTYIYERLEYL